MTKTLLVDGNNLMKIGFHGVKDYFHKEKHIGAIWHFLNTLRKFLEVNNYNKVVVFWDSDTNSSQRRLIYPKYKLNRRDLSNEIKQDSYEEQKQRVKQYLEEMFVRQLEVENSEADDLIAYYCQISEDENKTIFSSDRDLTQLISEKVSIYSPSTKKYYNMGDTIKISDFEVPHYNVKTIKILTGDFWGGGGAEPSVHSCGRRFGLQRRWRCGPRAGVLENVPPIGEDEGGAPDSVRGGDRQPRGAGRVLEARQDV